MGVASCHHYAWRWIVANCGWMLLLLLGTMPSGSASDTVTLAFVLPRGAVGTSFPTLRPIFGGVRSAITFCQNGSLPSPQVVLLPGTHTGIDSIGFFLPNGFTLRGALPSEVPAGGRAIIDCAGAAQRAFTLSDASSIVANLTVRRCSSGSMPGGAVLIYGVHSCINKFSGVNFEDNSAPSGGALSLVGDSLTTIFNDCIFKSNSATMQGGTLFIFGGNTTLTRCTVLNGTAPEGGGLYLHGGLVNLVHSHFLNCTSLINAAVSVIASSLLMSGGSIRNNVATTSLSSGVRVEASECNISGVLFDNNWTAENGAGLFLSGITVGPINVKNCTFSNNRALKKGGAINVNVKTGMAITDTKFISNTAFSGGAIDVPGVHSISSCTFRNNTAVAYGGGLNTEGTISIKNSNFSSNRAGTYGGGVSVRIGKTTLTGSLFVGNNAPLGGGVGVMAELVVSGTNFSSNTANTGGALYFQGKGSISNAYFSGNRAEIAGGGMYRLSSATVPMDAINNTQNLAAYGNDRASNAVAIILLRLSGSPNAAIFNRTSAKPEQIISFVVRILDVFGQQVMQFSDIPLVVDLLPMLASRRIGAVTSFRSTSISGGQAMVDLAVAGVMGDVVPVNFTIIAKPKMQATLFVFIQNCSDSEHLGADPKQLHDYLICIANEVWTQEKVSMGLTYGVCGMVALVMIFFVLLLLFVCIKAKLEVIKAASRIFVFGFLGWNMVLAVSAVGVSFEPSAPLCLVRAWLFFLGAFGVLTLLLAKVFSISRKCNVELQPTQSCSDTRLYLIASASNILMLTVLIVWFVVNPPLPTRMDTSVDNRTYMMTCGEHMTDQWPFLFTALGLLGVSSLLTVVFAFYARNVIMPFSETRFAVFSSYAAFAFLVVFVPLVVFMGRRPDNAALLVSLGQLIGSGTVVGFIVGQKVFIWKFPPIIGMSITDEINLLPTLPGSNILSSTAIGMDTQHG